MKPIITVKEARKLLGKDYDKLSDEKIVEIIEQLHELAKISLDAARQQLIKENQAK